MRITLSVLALAVLTACPPVYRHVERPIQVQALAGGPAVECVVAEAWHRQDYYGLPALELILTEATDPAFDEFVDAHVGGTMVVQLDASTSVEVPITAGLRDELILTGEFAFEEVQRLEGIFWERVR